MELTIWYDSGTQRLLFLIRLSSNTLRKSAMWTGHYSNEILRTYLALWNCNVQQNPNWLRTHLFKILVLLFGRSCMSLSSGECCHEQPRLVPNVFNKSSVPWTMSCRFFWAWSPNACPKFHWCHYPWIYFSSQPKACLFNCVAFFPVALKWPVTYFSPHIGFSSLRWATVALNSSSLISSFSKIKCLCLYSVVREIWISLAMAARVMPANEVRLVCWFISLMKYWMLDWTLFIFANLMLGWRQVPWEISPRVGVNLAWRIYCTYLIFLPTVFIEILAYFIITCKQGEVPPHLLHLANHHCNPAINLIH